MGIEIKVRWFAEVCLRMFDECLLRIYAEFRKQKRDRGPKYGFSTKWLDGALVPIMLPRIERDGSAILYWHAGYRRAKEVPRFAIALKDAPTKAEFDKYRRARIKSIYHFCPR